MMPYRTSSPESRGDAEEVVTRLGCRAAGLIDITPDRRRLLRTARRRTPRSRTLRRGNFAARARMMVLYDQSVTWNGLVIGTGNKTETLLGYTTLFGDNASAFDPIGDLYKSQVRQLSEAVGVPDAILRKPPTADLWPGQTDESEVGLRYAELDRLLYWMVDRTAVAPTSSWDGLRRADRSSASRAGRRLRVQAPDAARRQARAAARPASTTSIRGAGPCRSARD